MAAASGLAVLPGGDSRTPPPPRPPPAWAPANSSGPRSTPAAGRSSWASAAAPTPTAAPESCRASAPACSTPTATNCRPAARPWPTWPASTSPASTPAWTRPASSWPATWTTRCSGPEGAAAIFGPQKGATPEDVRELDGALANFVQVLADEIGPRAVKAADAPGAGAAGGVGYAAIAVLAATRRPGIDVVLEFTELADRLAGADLVITGEGSLDEQSLLGKTPMGVARAAALAGVPGGGRLRPHHAHARTAEGFRFPAGLPADRAGGQGRYMYSRSRIPA